VTYPWGAIVTVVTFALMQLAGIIVWAANEHAARAELDRRFAMHIMDQRREMDGLEARMDRIDYNGTRALQVVEDRQNGVLRRLDAQDMRMNELSQRVEANRQQMQGR
jgi:hypothetical protein